MAKTCSIAVVFGLAVLFSGPAFAKDIFSNGPRIKNPHLSRYRGPLAVNPAIATTDWTMPALCQAYNFPKNLPGGSVIGIAEFGGGYKIADINLFSKTYMNNTPINVTSVSVDGTQNSPSTPAADVDYEVTMDIQIAAAAYYYATGKAPTIKVFFASEGISDDNFASQNIRVINAAAAAGCDVLSISWGTSENYVSSSIAQAMETAAINATKGGMAIFASSGDGNSTNERQGETDGKNHLILPSSCPHIIAVGGTSKTTTNEVVWNNGFSLGTPYPLGTGGGFSTIFPIQSWQTGAPIAPATNNGRGRIVPDVSANADPLTPYFMTIDGSNQAVGNGTSASSPLWAGFVASFGKKPGFIAPTLWLTTSRVGYTDIVSGNNGQFQALVGPDACTGVGVPNGAKLYPAFQKPVTVPSQVTANYSGGTLTIIGDANANSLTISLQAGVVKVEGANGTKINNTSLYSSVVPATIAINVQLNAGDDAIAFVGINSSNATVDLGTGNDKAAFTLSNFGTLTVTGARPGVKTVLLTSTRYTTLHETNVP